MLEEEEEVEKEGEEEESPHFGWAHISFDWAHPSCFGQPIMPFKPSILEDLVTLPIV